MGNNDKPALDVELLDIGLAFAHPKHLVELYQGKNGKKKTHGDRETYFAARQARIRSLMLWFLMRRLKNQSSRMPMKMSRWRMITMMISFMMTMRISMGIQCSLLSDTYPLVVCAFSLDFVHEKILVSVSSMRA